MAIAALRLADLGRHLLLQGGQVDLGLPDVDLGPLDASLIAVEDRQGDREPDGPGVGALEVNGLSGIVLERIRLDQQEDVLEPLGLGQPDVRLSVLDSQPEGDEVRPGLHGQADQLLGRRRRRGLVPDRTAEFQPFGLVEPQVQERDQHRLASRSVSSASASPTLGGVALDLDPAHVGGRPLPAAEERLGRLENAVESPDARPRVADCLPRCQHIDIGCVEVVDLLADGVLVLSLDDPLGTSGHFGAKPALVVKIQRDRDVQVILDLAARALLGVTSVGNELGVVV